MEEIITKIKNFLEKREEVIFAYLFGSYLEVKNPQDIDIGVFVDERKVKDYFDYSLDLMGKLSFETGKHVDIHVINNAPLSLLKNIIQGKVLFSKDEKMRENFVEKVLREYNDYYELSKEFLKEVLDG